MKKIIQFTAFLSIVCLTGCASTGSYFVDRGRDVADIFTATAGMGAGAKVQLGPLQTGVIANADLAGLRGGKLFVYDNSNEIGFPDSGDLEAILYGTSWFLYDRHRNKKFHDGPYMLPIWDHGEVPFPFCRRPSYPRKSCPAYYTQIEATGGLLGTVRLGFNPGELLDFIFGWTTIDIYNDDIEKRKKIEQCN